MYQYISEEMRTRKPSYRWQTRATWKSVKNCSNSTCLQRCRWRYWPIFTRLAVVASEICEIPRNSLKIQTYGVQGHPRSSILVSIESPCTSRDVKQGRSGENKPFSTFKRQYLENGRRWDTDKVTRKSHMLFRLTRRTMTLDDLDLL